MGDNAPVLEAIAALKTSNEQQFKSLKQDVSVINDNLSGILERLNAQDVALNTLSNRVAAVEKTNTELTAGISQSEANILREINERNIRRPNVIVFNMIEAANSDLKTSLLHDSDTVKKLIQYIDPNLQNSFKTAYRLGKFVKNIIKPRPMRIVFCTQDQAQQFIFRFLEMKKAPQTSTPIIDCIVSRDRTPMQLAELKKLKAEAQTKVETRSQRWSVQFRGDIPKIVQIRKS